MIGICPNPQCAKNHATAVESLPQGGSVRTFDAPCPACASGHQERVEYEIPAGGQDSVGRCCSCGHEEPDVYPDVYPDLDGEEGL
jgi:hypothetical protein